jgi:hypothetical protein
MPLASLTVDLTLALAKFEGDSGKAAQVVARDQERMTGAARLFERQLERLADQANRTQGQFLALKAAELGVGGDGSKIQRLIDQIERQGNATAAASASQVASINSTTAAAETSVDRQRALNDQLVASIRSVNRAYEQRRAELIKQEQGGSITPEALKTGLSGLSATRSDAIRQLKEEAAAERVAIVQAEALAKADREAAAAAEAAAAKQRAAAQQIVDAQNGLLASYRQRLQILRELRDAGQISPAQFRAAGTDLVNSQPAVQGRRQEIEAAKLVADAAEQSALRQRAAAQAIIDQQNGITAGYRQRLAVLRELRDAELITPQQFRRAGTDLVNTQPAVAARRAEAEAAKKAADEIAAAAQKKAQAESVAAQSFVESIQRQADALGKTRTQLLLEEAARRGVADQVRPYIEKIAQADATLNKFGRTSGVARYQLLTLQYTLSDTIASLASGISPLTILLQQGGQVADVFAGNGGFAGVFRTLGSVITPFRVAVGASAAAVGVLGYAFYQGAQQSRDYADAITLTGNAAGQTEGKFNSLTRLISASGEVNVKIAREFALALINSGEVGARNFDLAAEAAARFGAATGKNAKEVASVFVSLNRDVGAGAAQLNQQYNFLTAAQLAQIKSLQEQGRSADALGIVYEALNTRLKALEPNLGILDRALRSASNAWQTFWDRAYDIGRTQTIDDKLEQARARLVAAQRAAADAPSIGPYGGPRPSGASRVQQIEEEIRLLQRSKDAQQDSAAAAAELVKLNRDAAGADEFVRGMERRSKSAAGLARELAEANAQFAKQDALAAKDPSYKPSSPETRAAILKRIQDDFTDKPAITESNQVAKAERDKALKAVEESLKAERDLYAFHNQYLQQIYNAGEVSLEAFFDARRSAADRDEQAQIQGLNKQIEIQQKYLEYAKRRDPSDAVATEKAIASLQDDVARATLNRQRRVVLANAEEAASYRQLLERVNEFRAQQLQLQGDDAGAARLRAANAIAQAQQLARQSGGQISEDDLRRQREALDLANEFAEVQRRNSIATADAGRAEELFQLRAKQGGLSLLETERGILEIRQAALAQLAELTARARGLADVSNDPKIKAFADDLALQFAKAAETVDPALNRIRAAADEAGGSMAASISGAIIKFTSFKDLVGSLEQSLLRLGTKLLVQDPLEDFFKRSLRTLTEGEGLVGTVLKGAVGVGGAGNAGQAAAQTAAQAAQTAAVTTSTASLATMTAAATAAAAALAQVAGTSGVNAAGGLVGLLGKGAGTGLEGLSSDALAYFFHEGGVVGAGGRAARVPAAAFVGARRYHSGGIAGLAADEVPSVLRIGEEVVKRSDPRHRANGGGMSSAPYRETPMRPLIQNFNFTTPPDRRSQMQVGAEAMRGLQRSQRNM